MKHIPLPLLAVGLLATACTATTPNHQSHRTNFGYAPVPYMPYQRGSGGYITKELTPGVYTVGFMGNAGTTREMANDSARYRAAEVTLRSGFRYFRVLDTARDDGWRVYLSDGNWIEIPYYIYTIQCQSEFTPESVDATQLMHALGTAYARS